MKRLILHPTETSQWHALVNDALARRSIQVGEELESYLVFLLMRFTQEAHMASSIFAVEYLQSHHQDGVAQRGALRDVGDKCLLFSGLFPENAARRQVTLNYFVNMGQSAYGTLAGLDDMSELFGKLAHGFVTLMDVLQAMREMPNLNEFDNARSALELWNECPDEKVDELIQRYSNLLIDVKSKKH